MYYRLAYTKYQTAVWSWKTTALTSFPAVLHWLRIYSFFPQDQMRVFSSLSREDLKEMLRCENNGLPSGSVTADQFLRDRYLQPHKGTRYASTQETTAPLPGPSTTVAISTSEGEHRTKLFPPEENGMSWLDRKRLEIERGSGSDHNTSYYFSLPIALPQLLAWIRLQNSVREETLQR